MTWQGNRQCCCNGQDAAGDGRCNGGARLIADEGQNQADAGTDEAHGKFLREEGDGAEDTGHLLVEFKLAHVGTVCRQSPVDDDAEFAKEGRQNEEQGGQEIVFRRNDENRNGRYGSA